MPPRLSAWSPLAAAAALLATGAGLAAPAPHSRAISSIRFADVTAASGISLLNHSGDRQKLSILDSLGNGACWIDYDNDGLPDLYITNGSTLANLQAIAKGQPGELADGRLYHNLGHGRFEDVTAQSGIRYAGWEMGCAVGDYDNDGRDDLFITGVGHNALFRNLGGGRFQDVTAAAGVRGGGWSTSASFADLDGSGRLDLYVARYVDYNVLDPPRFGLQCGRQGVPVFCGPLGLPGSHDLLYRNNGDGTFTDISRQAGIDAGPPHYGLGVVVFDADGDGRPDIYIASDSTPATLWHNDGHLRFTDTAGLAGVAFSGDGREQARMGVDVGDIRNDGHFALVTTNFSSQTYSLFEPVAPGFYQDDTFAAGVGATTLPYLGWGVGFHDFDNDGWLDLFAADGHVYPQFDEYQVDSRYEQPKLLFRNRGDGTFASVGAGAGPGMNNAVSSRGAAFADFDNDGRVDVFVNNIDAQPQLLRNVTPGGHWAAFKLIGTKSNRDAIGALVWLKTARGTQMRLVHDDGSYLSAGDLRVHFGLGAETRIESVRVRWPSGLVQEFNRVPSDRIVTLVEGRTLQ